jgi:predicted nucleotidyltransferase
VKNDRIIWRETGWEMSALGFEEAFQSARPKTIAPGLSVSVVSIPALIILKITAYLNRPQERVRDMVDLVYCLAEYERSGDQRFELIGEEVHGQPLFFEEAGAFLVGEQVARLAKPKARSRVDLFLEQLTDEYARPINQILAQEKRIEEETRREDLFRLLRAFSAGFERHR